MRGAPTRNQPNCHLWLAKDRFANGRTLTVTANSSKGSKKFDTVVRIDTPQEIEYYEHGGILQYVLRQLAAK